MSKPLHLDLLKDEERYSSSPVRLRVMLPMVAALATLCFLIWWALLGLRSHNQSTLKDQLQKNILKEKAAHAIVIDLRAQQKETKAIIQQLKFYEHARVRFGEALVQLAAHVPAEIQLTEIRLPPPPPPLIDPKLPALGPTNTMELLTLRIAGRASDNKASESVNTLLASLRKPAFTNLFQTADIPKGAFRQDSGRSLDNRETLLFEIRCVCVPRRFE